MTIGGNIDGQALTEMEMVYPNGKAIQLTRGSVNYAGSTLVESVYEASVYKHQYVTMNPSVVDKILKACMTTGEPLFRFRLGFGNPDRASWLPWQSHSIVGYAALLQSLNQQSGHGLEIETSDALYVMTAQSKTVARRGTVAEIVTQIAVQQGLDYVVEPTLGSFLMIQSFENDVDFVRRRLVPRALNAKNRGGYFFFIRDNVLHFHTPDYQTSVKEIVYYQSTGSRLSQVDNSQRLFGIGNAGVCSVVYDPYSGAAREISANPENALKLADGIYQLPRSYTKQLRFTLGENRSGEALAIAQTVYESARLNTFELVLSVAKIVDIRAGDILRVIINPREGTATVWSGFYIVTRIVYTVNRGEVNAVCTLVRGEIQKDPLNNSIQSSDDTLVPLDDAPGQPLSLQEVQSSTKTKGAGSQTATGHLVVVADPN